MKYLNIVCSWNKKCDFTKRKSNYSHDEKQVNINLCFIMQMLKHDPTSLIKNKLLELNWNKCMHLQKSTMNK